MTPPERIAVAYKQLLGPLARGRCLTCPRLLSGNSGMTLGRVSHAAHAKNVSICIDFITISSYD